MQALGLVNAYPLQSNFQIHILFTEVACGARMEETEFDVLSTVN